MFCEKCGQQIHDEAVVCPSCGVATKRSSVSEAVPNYLVGSIITTIFCCNPASIASLVFAIISNSKKNAGDIEGAKSASKVAFYCMIGGIALGLIFGLLCIINVMVEASSY